MTAKPAALGYRMPAEWEPHESTWIAWPHNREDWPGKFAPIPWVYAEIVRHLVRSEPVDLIVHGNSGRAKAEKALVRAGVPLDQVRFHKWKTDRVWLRDTGPSFVVKTGDEGTRSVGVVDWRFNAWAKYDNYHNDHRIPRRIADKFALPRWKPEAEIDGEAIRIVMEGGAIDVNGLGTILTTEECLLSEVQARNPRLDREAVEKAFADYLGATNTIWLGRGIVGDDTHGHVDDLARFVDPKTVVTVVEADETDPNFEPLQDNLARLKAARDQNGEPLNVVTLPMPRPLIFEDQRLPASYANFYIANKVVLVPTFNDPHDSDALKILAGCFKDREVVGIHAVDLVWGLGTLHCLSREQPKLLDERLTD